MFSNKKKNQLHDRILSMRLEVIAITRPPMHCYNILATNIDLQNLMFGNFLMMFITQLPAFQQLDCFI